MRKNYEESRKPIDQGSNFTRVKVQSTIAISQVSPALHSVEGTDASHRLLHRTELKRNISENLSGRWFRTFFELGRFLNVTYLIYFRYAQKDRGMRATSFTKGVEKLALNLYNIVRDTSQIKAHEDDFIMLVL